jgi:hypothetical protein
MAVKVDKTKRAIWHEVFPQLIQGPVGSVASKIDWLIRTKGDGLTPGEKEYLLRQAEELKTVHANLNKIYFRLKV